MSEEKGVMGSGVVRMVIWVLCNVVCVRVRVRVSDGSYGIKRV